jgi:anti-sigma factor RsiW
MTADDHSSWRAMLHGYADGELDSIHVAEFEAHLATCADCRGELARLEAMRALLAKPEVKFRAPEDVRRQVIAALNRDTRPAARPAESTWQRILRLTGQWSLVPSMAALAAGLFLFFNVPTAEPGLQDQLVSSHVRSLLADHLTDVMTSDRHTVKPWFAGKIDFSPPVVDLKSVGFPLAGGRVDYLNGRVVAALVFRRGGHVINLFIWPDAAQPDRSISHESYNIREWSAGGLVFWAVSDTEMAQLETFRERFVAAVEADTGVPQPIK